jgi:hypothetical protein
MSVFRCCSLVLVLVGLVLIPPPASAQEATPASAGVVLPPDANVAGLSLAEWTARYWQWFFSFPEAINPFFDETGERCGYGQSGPVFFLEGAPASAERTCTVPLGVTLFVPVTGVECSTVEPPPYFGRDEAELRACAVDGMNQHLASFTALEVSVDGQAIGDLAPYRVSTPPFPLLLPPGNVLGTTTPVAHSVGDGFQVLLAPLTEGDHVITISEGPFTVTYRLTVAAPQVVEPAASPVASPVS